MPHLVGKVEEGVSDMVEEVEDETSLGFVFFVLFVFVVALGGFVAYQKWYKNSEANKRRAERSSYDEMVRST